MIQINFKKSWFKCGVPFIHFFRVQNIGQPCPACHWPDRSRGPEADRPESGRDFQIFLGPGPIRFEVSNFGGRGSVRDQPVLIRGSLLLLLTPESVPLNSQRHIFWMCLKKTDWILIFMYTKYLIFLTEWKYYLGLACWQKPKRTMDQF